MRPLLAVLLLAACSSDPAPPPAADAAACEFVGDRAQPAEMQLFVLGVGNRETPLADGGDVPLVTPPQGGLVLFVGARVRNASTCSARLTGALRDPATQQVRLDARHVATRVSADGWIEPPAEDFSSVANVPVCHNTWSSRDVHDQVYELELTYEYKDGGERRTVSRTLSVTPRCAEDPPDECRCICRQGYRLGDPC